MQILPAFLDRQDAGNTFWLPGNVVLFSACISIVLSAPAVARRLPSELKATLLMATLWPQKVSNSWPKAASHTFAAPFFLVESARATHVRSLPNKAANELTRRRWFRTFPRSDDKAEDPGHPWARDIFISLWYKHFARKTSHFCQSEFLHGCCQQA